MPRPRRLDKPVEKKLSLDAEVARKTELLLFSELEGRVPYGAWSGLIEQLLREYFASKARRETFDMALGEIAHFARTGDDPEASHIKADVLLVDELTSLGYDLSPFNSMVKYYA